MTTNDVLMHVKDLVKHFPITQGIVIQRQVGAVRAVDGISFDIHKGETLGLVGESGFGKSTTGLLERKPKQLSGGQRQRVAVGRAIVRKPAVFLFDEPLSNLDAKLRVQMRAELSKLHDRLGTTMIYVTHDQVEAMTMGTKIVVMKDGFIQQVGAPLEVFNYPDNMFVAGFIGSPVMNFIPCRILSKDSRLFIDADAFQLPIPDKKVPYYPKLAGSEAIFGIRPNDIYNRLPPRESINKSASLLG